MDPVDLGRIILGLALLAAGGESLVRGASALARRIGISALVIGLTVVAAATSAPELAVSVGAVLRGDPGLAVGNVLGSNIANILLILGISALLLPLAVKQRLVRLDLPFMVTMSVALLLVSLDGAVTALDGLILIGLLSAHSVLAVLISRREARRVPSRASEHGGEARDDREEADEEIPAGPVTKSLLLVAAGVGLLVLGATLLVDGAVSIAAAFGVSSLVVGLTVVAVGTSLPELAVAVIAVRKGKRDLAVGNVVGSNIFNIGIVLGVPALISTGGVPVPAAAVALDLPLMLAAAVALLPAAFTGFTVARWEGGLFLALYAAYTGFLVLAATQHDALAGFTTTMVWFVLPLVAVTLIVFTSYEVGLRKGRREALGGERRNL